MKITMVVATSRDGFITNGDDPNQMEWTSKEDKAILSEQVSKHKLIVMGRNTYEASSKKLSPNHCKVILTNNPENYSELQLPGRLEFKSLSPKKFIQEYSDFESCLVLGGAFVFTEFFDNQLFDEIYLTVEPLTFGNGISLFTNGGLEKLNNLPEPDIKKLNDNGTVLKHYILKN